MRNCFAFKVCLQLQDWACTVGSRRRTAFPETLALKPEFEEVDGESHNYVELSRQIGDLLCNKELVLFTWAVPHTLKKAFGSTAE